MIAAEPVPLVLLTGFLGAGKTTLLNRLLREPDLARSAVVVNEFGEVGIDHLLVERAEGEHLMLSTGCICCAARGDLVSALTSLLGRHAASFDRILVETTGMADPRPILDALLLDPTLRQACRLDAVLTVVDARDGLAMLAHRREARRQAALADAMVLSKLDAGVGEAGSAQLAARLVELNPLAPIIDGRDIGAVAAALRGQGARIRVPPPGAESERHHHRHAHHEVEALVLRAGIVDPRLLEAFLHVLLQRHGSHLLRLKGFVATRDDPERPHLVQVVGERPHPGVRLDAWPDANRSTRLVVILEGLPAGVVEELWTDMFGPPAIDRPDAAALARHEDRGAGLF